MTFEEKVDKILQNRVNALSSKRGALISEVELQDERDFNNSYLFGDGTHLGVVNFLELYYRELNLAVGRTATTPALHNGVGTTKNNWTSQFTTAVTTAGDGSLYLDSNSDGVADEDINTNVATISAWLYQNGDQGQSTPVTSPIESSFNTVRGVVASDASDGRTSNYTYPDSESALSAGQARADADNGSGLLGKRTQNADDSDTAPEITTEQDLVSPFEWRYVVGVDGVDHPDYYNTPEKTNLENNLSSAISTLQSYYNHLTEVETQTQNIDNETNILFVESGMKDSIDTATELSNIQSQKTDIQDSIDSFQAELDYFSSFTASNDISAQAGYNRTTFNNKLTTTIPNLFTSANSQISSRVAEIESIIGLNNSALDFSFRKWLFFWIEQNIAKPISPYVGLNGIGTALANANKAIGQANNTLDVLFGDPTLYLPTPKSLAAYFDPVMDSEGVFLEELITYLWLGTPVVNKYKIFRRIITTDTPDNTNWTDVDLLTWITSINPNSGMVEIQHTDEPVIPNTVYSYRVQSFDTVDGPTGENRLDSFNTSSLQSPVYEEEGINFSSIVAGLITTTVDHEFEEGDYVAILGTASDGFYQVGEQITPTTLQLLNTTLNEGTGTVHKTYGIVSYSI